MNNDERIQVEIDQHRQAAITYVWGRQDAGEGPYDSRIAWEFSIAYATHRSRYIREESCWATNLRDAFLVWRAIGEIPGDSTAFSQALGDYIEHKED